MDLERTKSKVCKYHDEEIYQRRSDNRVETASLHSFWQLREGIAEGFQVRTATLDRPAGSFNPGNHRAGEEMPFRGAILLFE